jgi:hypothetical protein
MGGDQVVEALCGAEVEKRLGDEIRDAEGELYMELSEAGAVAVFDSVAELCEQIDTTRLSGGGGR